MNKLWQMNDIADDLNITVDTLNNWIRTKALPALSSQSPFPMDQSTKEKLYDQIHQSSRLKHRANRLFRRKEFESDTPYWLSQLERFGERDLINLFIKKWIELVPQDSQTIMNGVDWHWNPPEVDLDHKACTRLLHSCPEDPLGALLQRLQNPKDRIKWGSFFTPMNFCHEMLSCQGDIGELTMFDPATGSGRFIAAFLALGGSHNNIWAMESNETSYKIARFNFKRWVPHFSGEPPIFLGDSLTADCSFLPPKGVDLVITNPPWGTIKAAERKKNPTQACWKTDQAGQFMKLGSTVLSPEGKLNLLLPQSIITQKIHSPLREELSRRGDVKWIKLWDKSFPGVQSPIMNFCWSPQKRDLPMEIEVSGMQFLRDQYSPDENLHWDIFCTPEDQKLWKKISHKCGRTLGDSKAQWQMGIVTGNNKGCLSEERQSNELPIIKGSDIFPWGIKNSKTFLSAPYEQLQQAPSLSLYQTPLKLVYRFIGSKPVAALDDDGRIPLNSANTIIFPEKRDMIFLYFLLNCPLYTYLYRKKFPGLKVLKGNLMQLPYPELTDSKWESLPFSVDNIPSWQTHSLEFHHWICSFFNLTAREVKKIEQ